MKNILIIGGYGAVGSIICEKLSREFSGKIVAAGRSFERAKILANRLGNSIIPKQFDLDNISSTDILHEIDLVIMCIDQQGTHFVELCIERGIDFIDITANQKLIEKIEKLKSRAKDKKTKILLSVGLAPGITNLLAQHAVNNLRDAKRLNLFILLGLGEKHGDAAYRWTFNNIHTKYDIQEDRKLVKLKSFTSPLSTSLIGKRTFYLFNFSDQHNLLKTTGITSIRTRMAFDSKFLTWFISLLRKTKLTKVFKSRKVQDSIIFLFKQTLFGNDMYGVKAALENPKGEIREYYLTGKGEGKVTAYIAFLAALHLLKKQPQYGILHLNEAIPNIPEFLNLLKELDSSIEFNL